MQHAIAILDSGVGGLTVAKEIMKQLPQEPIIYFGDTARAPYGPRPAEEVLLFTEQIVDYLCLYEPKMIVIACNTATAIAMEHIRAKVDIPVVGVIDPGARAALINAQGRTVGVIGTQGTIDSGAYEQALRRLAPDIRVISLACPQLVPLVEKGLYASPEASGIVSQSLAPFSSEKIDSLILGCTHYPFLSDVISEVMGPTVELINSAGETAREVSAILSAKKMLAEDERIPVHRFLCSGEPSLFTRIARSWLDEQIRNTPVIWNRVQLWQHYLTQQPKAYSL